LGQSRLVIGCRTNDDDDDDDDDEIFKYSLPQLHSMTPF
jgi:hypothetical protein